MDGVIFWSFYHAGWWCNTVHGIMWWSIQMGSNIWAHGPLQGSLLQLYVIHLVSGKAFLTQIYCLSIQKHCGELLNQLWGQREWEAGTDTTPTRYQSRNRASCYDWSTIQINIIRLSIANVNNTEADCDPRELPHPLVCWKALVPQREVQQHMWCCRYRQPN